MQSPTNGKPRLVVVVAAAVAVVVVAPFAPFAPSNGEHCCDATHLGYEVARFQVNVGEGVSVTLSCRCVEHDVSAATSGQ